MGRPIFTYELTDPDFSWLISNFRENNPQYSALESGSLPVVFISSQQTKVEVCEENEAQFETPPPAEDADPKEEISQNKRLT